MASSFFRIKVGKQGRIVLPKRLREAFDIKEGDEAVIIAVGGELSMHLHKVSEDPLQDLIELSKEVSVGLSAEQLKKLSEEERIKHFLET